MKLSRDIGIDLGTANILVYEEGKGIVLREPSVVAVDKNTGKVLQVGAAARNMLGRTPGNIVAVRPLRDGVISDYEMTEKMLDQFLKKISKFSLIKPRVIVCVPSGVTEVEERAVIQATMEAGARRVYLIEEPYAAALGAKLDITGPDGHMVVDIGGGTTEIAVVSMGGVAECESIKTAGSTFDEAIIRYIKKKHNMLIGAMTAEEVKINIGGVYPRSDAPESMEVKGRDLIKGLPKTVSVTAEELVDVLREPARLILENVHAVLERTPPELIGDLGVNGMILSGGGSLLYGIDRMIEDSTHIRTMIVDDPLACAAHGAGKLLTKLDSMQDGMMNFLRNREMRN
ncbi:MAG: rod shape-determining protein [Clostridiales bacterium]|nr:rod shape-determining protein [Clostridiales bacterium]